MQLGLIVTDEIENEWVIMKAGSMELALHRIGQQYADMPTHVGETSNTKLVFTIDGDINLFRNQLIATGT